LKLAIMSNLKKQVKASATALFSGIGGEWEGRFLVESGQRDAFM
jgi:hypothetical protein